MNKFKISGFLMLKDQGVWQRIKDGIVIKVPNHENEYEIACTQFSTIADYWMIVVDKIEE